MLRYRKPADWELLTDLAARHAVPLIGNGDVLTHYEVCTDFALSEIPLYQLCWGAVSVTMLCWT